MRELTWMERNGLSPGKIILVGALIGVFAIVFCVRVLPIFLRGSGGNAEVAAQPSTNSGSAKVVRTPRNPLRASENKSAGRTISDRTADDAVQTADEWKTIPIDEVVLFDPFRYPSEMRLAMHQQSETAPNVPTENASVAEIAMLRQRTLEHLMERGVDIVVMSDSERIAAIGDVQLREGDILNGLMVKRISRSGIELVEVADERIGNPLRQDVDIEELDEDD